MGAGTKSSNMLPVVIEDDVEIQSNSCIDRATVERHGYGAGKNWRFSGLWATLVKVGEDTILAGKLGLLARPKLATAAFWRGKWDRRDTWKIGDGATITSQSGIHLDVPPGAVRSEYPVMENSFWLKVIAALKRLPEMQKTLRELAGEMSGLRDRRNERDGADYGRLF